MNIPRDYFVLCEKVLGNGVRHYADHAGVEDEGQDSGNESKDPDSFFVCLGQGVSTCIDRLRGNLRCWNREDKKVPTRSFFSNSAKSSEFLEVADIGSYGDIGDAE